jgi:hypothetical protein
MNCVRAESHMPALYKQELWNKWNKKQGAKLYYGLWTSSRQAFKWSRQLFGLTQRFIPKFVSVPHPEGKGQTASVGGKDVR